MRVLRRVQIGRRFRGERSSAAPIVLNGRVRTLVMIHKRNGSPVVVYSRIISMILAICLMGRSAMPCGCADCSSVRCSSIDAVCQHETATASCHHVHRSEIVSNSPLTINSAASPLHLPSHEGNLACTRILAAVFAPSPIPVRTQCDDCLRTPEVWSTSSYSALLTGQSRHNVASPPVPRSALARLQV